MYRYLCMTKILSNQISTITHGKALLKNQAENAVNYMRNDYAVSSISWVARADTPHECTVRSCILKRIYLRHKLWDIGVKRMLYEECKRFLYTKLPRDIVIYILEKCFCKKQIKYNC